MRKKLGKFISIEGGDGSGKSTQVKKLVAALKKRGIECLVTREPGGSPGAESIRELLVNGKPGRWDGTTETLLLYAARRDHIDRVVKPALAEGKWVVSDRFSDSTYAYQGVARGVNRETIRRIEAVSIGDFKPDLTLIVDVPAEIGLARAGKRSGKETRFEEFGEAFQEKLRQGFLDIAKRARERCVVIDGSGDEHAVAEEILKAVTAKFALK